MGKMSAQIMLPILLAMICVTITPTRAKNDGLCWNRISKCLLDHEARSLVEPKYNPKSPSFNVTEYLCCPLTVQTAQIEKTCFCIIDTVIHQNPSLASNVTDFLSVCGVVDSVASLDNYCLGVAPAPASAPLFPPVAAPMMPVLPPL